MTTIKSTFTTMSGQLEVTVAAEATTFTIDGKPITPIGIYDADDPPRVLVFADAAGMEVRAGLVSEDTATIYELLPLRAKLVTLREEALWGWDPATKTGRALKTEARRSWDAAIDAADSGDLAGARERLAPAVKIATDEGGGYEERQAMVLLGADVEPPPSRH